MKAQNIQSNTSAPTLAGREYGSFMKDKDQQITMRLLADSKKLHTVEDIKHYCDGAKETMGKNKGSADSMACMIRLILRVATANDDKLNSYHKIKTAAAGQKVVKAQIDKGFTGLDSLSKALRPPSAPKVSDSEGKGESEPTAKNAPSLEAELKAFVKKQHDNGHTNLDIGNAMAALSIELCRA
jgi:hypothetical protein